MVRRIVRTGMRVARRMVRSRFPMAPRFRRPIVRRVRRVVRRLGNRRR